MIDYLLFKSCMSKIYLNTPTVADSFLMQLSILLILLYRIELSFQGANRNTDLSVRRC